jgi:hypothetical protein
MGGPFGKELGDGAEPLGEELGEGGGPVGEKLGEGERTAWEGSQKGGEIFIEDIHWK